jgi:Fe-S-cluster containining protein
VSNAAAASDQNAIPCEGCTQCCKNDQVILRPEDGDDLSFYEWEPIASQLYPGRTSPALKRDPVTGHCIYLTEAGCSIHAKRPATCRRFHCARTAKALEELPRRTRKILKRRGDVFDEALLERGRDRLRLAREMGLDHLLDTERQKSAFERIAAMPPPPKDRR